MYKHWTNFALRRGSIICISVCSRCE